MKVILHIFAAGMVLGLMGCGGMNPDRYLAEKRAFLTNQGNPPSYVAGYLDGCSSGKRMAGDKRFSYLRDTTKANRDALYARGWQEGQIYCRNEDLIEQEKEQKAKEARAYSDLDEERRRRVEAESRAAEAEVREIWEELKK